MNYHSRDLDFALPDVGAASCIKKLVYGVFLHKAKAVLASCWFCLSWNRVNCCIHGIMGAVSPLPSAVGTKSKQCLPAATARTTVHKCCEQSQKLL